MTDADHYHITAIDQVKRDRSYLCWTLWGFAQTDRGIALAGAGTIGTELKAEQHFVS